MPFGLVKPRELIEHGLLRLTCVSHEDSASGVPVYRPGIYHHSFINAGLQTRVYKYSFVNTSAKQIARSLDKHGLPRADRDRVRYDAPLFHEGASGVE